MIPPAAAGACRLEPGATTLRKAIEAAKGLIKEYDEAPYTAEDVAKLDAARTSATSVTDLPT